MHTKILTFGLMLLFIIPFANNMILNASGTNHNNVITNQQHTVSIDSKEDLIVAGYDNITVLYGDGAGGFPQQENYPKGEGQADVIAEDFNGDDSIDVAVTSYWDAEVTVCINDGFGGFSDSINYSVGTGVTAIDSDDFNEDGFLDIISCNAEDTNSITILFGDGSGGFGDRTDFFGEWVLTDIVVADFDNDTHLDIAVTQYPMQKVFVLFGDGSGSFPNYDTYTVGVYPYQITCGDVNNDESTDIVVTNYDQYAVGSIKVLLNDGAGGFTSQFEYMAGLGTLGIVTDYFDDDNFLDIAVTNFIDGTLMIFINDGSGGFDFLQEIFIGIMPYGLASVDLNRDSVQDLAVAISDEDTVCILLGTGAGTFLSNGYQSVGATPYAIATANVNPTSGAPMLSIDIQNKKVIVTNTGDADAEQVTGQINITGGILRLIDKQEPFSSEVLSVNQELVVPLPSVFGLGPLKIDVWVEASNSERVQKSAEGFIVFFWLFLK
ncbi:MAG TPA: VCBS repeat-containing protein [Candidatus Thermoplasmatota archaeon]|nr:VCBS repeat-containing protein [Candidatus Thermoplasmatota archaeon]